MPSAVFLVETNAEDGQAVERTTFGPVLPPFWSGAGGVAALWQGAAGFRFTIDPAAVALLSAQLRVRVSGFAGVAGTLSVSVVPEVNARNYSTARLPTTRDEVPVGSLEVAAASPGDDLLVDLDPEALAYYAGGTKLCLTVEWSRTAEPETLNLRLREAGFVSELSVSWATAEEFEAMARHAARQALDIVMAALKSAGSVPDAAIIEEDPRTVDLADQISPTGAVIVWLGDEECEHFSPHLESPGDIPRYARSMVVRVIPVAHDPIQRDALRVDVEKALAGIDSTAAIREVPKLRMTTFEASAAGQKKLYAAQLSYAIDYHVLANAPDVPLSN